MKKLLIVGIMFLGTLSYGGCKINLFVKNISDQELEVYNVRYPVMVVGVYVDKPTAVKSKGGKWRSTTSGRWMGDGSIIYQDYRFKIQPNEKLGNQYGAALGCNWKRRYRVAYLCQDGSYFTKYYPSSTGWTKKQTLTVNIGDACPEIQEVPETPEITRTYTNPTIGTRKLDFCKTWGQGCGEPAATYFCQRKGMTRASAWEEDRDIGNTFVLGDNKECNMAGCDGFKFISCLK